MINQRVTALIAGEQVLATTDVVVMEVLAGARNVEHARSLRRLLLSCELLPVFGLSDFEEAAAIHQQCRRSGARVRSLSDCLIAAVAIRARAPILHADRDFQVIARHFPLSIAI